MKGMLIRYLSEKVIGHAEVRCSARLPGIGTIEVSVFGWYSGGDEGTHHHVRRGADLRSVSWLP